MTHAIYMTSLCGHPGLTPSVFAQRQMHHCFHWVEDVDIVDVICDSQLYPHKPCTLVQAFCIADPVDSYAIQHYYSSYMLLL